MRTRVMDQWLVALDALAEDLLERIYMMVCNSSFKISPTSSYLLRHQAYVTYMYIQPKTHKRKIKNVKDTKIFKCK